MSFKEKVFKGIAAKFGNQTFSTAKLASALGFRSEDVSSAISQLRNNDGMVKFTGVRSEGNRAIRHYQLTEQGINVLRQRHSIYVGSQTGAGNGPSFVAATDAHNAQGRPTAGGGLAAKLGSLVAAVTPAKGLKDYSDDELFVEIKRRLQA